MSYVELSNELDIDDFQIRYFDVHFDLFIDLIHRPLCYA